MSKGMLNRLLPIWECLAISAQRVGCATPGDITIFQDRARAEGLPYLTDGLAGMGRVFLDGIRKGFVTKEEFVSIRQKPKVGSTLPMFLYSAWSQVFTDEGLCIGCRFDDDDGLTIKSYNPPVEAEVAVRWLRQLTVVFAKMQLPHNDSAVTAVVNRFIENEQGLAAVKGRLWATQYTNNIQFPHKGSGRQRLTDVLLRARRIICKSLCNVNTGDISPKHGSGASACSTRPWERYDRILFHPDQNAIWPWLEYAASGKEHCSQLLSADFITDGYPRIARGVFVPKDYRGPRFISCEPATSMYYQQGLMAKLVKHLESDSYTSGYVNFTDQSINQALAHLGSVNRKTATLDLKDASDLLSWDLITLLWPDHWYKALSAVRSKVTKIELPNGNSVLVPLRKHAPMGSAVCFPVMALTIWALIKAANFSPGPNKAWIYGDDIIVASEDAQSVIDLLESVDLRVNRQKSFFGATPFRESCGKEYWDGGDVTPVYCRYNPDNNDIEAASLISFAVNFAKTRGIYVAFELNELIHEMTGAPIIGVDEVSQFVFDTGSDAYINPLRNSLAPRSGSVFEQNSVPFLLFGCHCQCMRSQVRRRSAVCAVKGTNYNKMLYRIRRPYPVDIKILPESWGYVLRSSLIGGDLGFAESTALAKRVVYKYGWVALDW